MPKANALLHAFNRGEISKDALGRVDVERMRLSAEEQVNWLPRTLGPMMLRPGLEYIGGIYNNAKSLHIPFVFGTTDTALLECTNGAMRVLVNETPIMRVGVATAITNGDFASGASWTLATSGGASAVISGGVLQLACSALGGVANALQAVTVAVADINKEHGLRVVVITGPVTLRVGSTSGGDDLIGETSLETGTHSIAFTPTTSSAYVYIESRAQPLRTVDSIQVEAAGTMVIPAFWTEADLGYLRWQQSGDIIYLACYGHQQRRIERRGVNSWSLVLYKTSDGPFQASASRPFRLSVTASHGDGALNSEAPFFKPGHVGTLFRLFTTGSNFAHLVGSADAYAPAVRVSGTGADRGIGITVAGGFVGTVTLQRSFDSADSGFVDVSTYTTATSASYTDGLSNSIVWYRLGFKPGNYTSGTPNLQISYNGAGGAGVCRVTGYVSPTQVNVEVLSPFTSNVYTLDWRQGDWSDLSGWPSAVTLHDGRLFWGGRDKVWGSISDAYSSFDISYEGDAGPISRSIATGPVAIINWLLALQRLIVGAEESEVSIRSSSFDEPLTPTSLTLKDCSTQGSARVLAVKVDGRGLFVQKSKRKLFQLGYSVDTQDYAARDLNQLHPALNDTDIVAIAVQRQPDTRIHCVRADGTVAVLVYDIDESVTCWWRIETDGIVEGVVVLPGTVEDRVYYSVARTVQVTTKRYLERHARMDECVGDTVNRQADCHIVYSGVPSATIGGLGHMEGRNVIVWADGKDFSPEQADGTPTTFTVAGGEIVLPQPVSEAVVGLYYRARFKSAKLAYASGMGTAMLQKKRVNYLGLLMRHTHFQGIKFGQSFDVMDDLPLVEDGAVTDPDTVWEDFDKPAVELPGEWNTDARLCLEASAPRPATVLATVIGMATSDKA